MSGVTVVYLGGFGRSGSTLVERMLGAAHGWVNIGELVDLARSVGHSDELCGCGQHFSKCPLWTQVGEVAFGGWTEEVLDRLAGLQRAAARQRHLPGLLGPSRRASDALNDLRTAYASIYSAVAEATGARVIVDASKGPALGQALAGAPGHRPADAQRRTGSPGRRLVLEAPPRAPPRHLRHRRDVADPRAPGGRAVDRAPAGDAGHRPPRRRPVGTASLRGLRRRPRRNGGGGDHRARCSDRRRRPPARRRGPGRARPQPRTVRQPSRFRSGAVELCRDDAWTTEMPSRDRAVVTALTLPLLMAYGYSGDRRHRRRARAHPTPTRNEEHRVTGHGPETTGPARGQPRW